jgi:hypothetical protein
VEGWKPEDSVHSEHKLWSPSCPFLADPRKAGNITIADEKKVFCDGLVAIEEGKNHYPH